MNKKAKKEFLKWAIPCMEHMEIYSEEIQEYKKRVWPKIKEECYKGLKTGEVNENILKYWYEAYPNVINLIKEGVETPMKEYMFTKHNEIVVALSKINNKILPCFALVGVVINTGEKTIVDVLGKEKTCSSGVSCSIGSYVGVHMNTIIEKLKKQEFLKYKNLLEKYKPYL